MNIGVLYMDASALVKLVLMEPETPGVLGILDRWPERASSAVAGVEMARAVKRSGLRAGRYRPVEEVLSRVGLIGIDEAVLRTAATIEPRELRTLDAIHLATAVSLREALGGLVTYDRRLASAARAHGIEVFAPATASS